MPESSQSDFAAFYRATVAPLRRYLARMLGDGNEAQDVAHDAYSRMYAAMDTQFVSRPKAFLFTTARRLAFNQVRRRHVSPIDSAVFAAEEHAPSGAPSVERLVVAREEWARLERAIAELPSGCRSVLLLCKLERLSHIEIGARLGIAVSTVEKQHARALRLLREAVALDELAPESAPRPRMAGEA